MSAAHWKDGQLLKSVNDSNIDAVKAWLKAGANANGNPKHLLPPIAVAAFVNHAGILNLLLEQGADPDRPVAMELSTPGGLRLGVPTALIGERALHIAARSRSVEIVRLLLTRSRAEPNATDDRGETPLMATCRAPHVDVEVVRLLLEAGADAASALKSGIVPMHIVAYYGHTDLVDMLYSRAPATLNRCRRGKGYTPLFIACSRGHEGVVSKLLSLGATQPDDSDMCPLVAATEYGLGGVVRVLINQGGVRAVGGEEAVARALYAAVRFRQVRTLRMLISVDGDEGRSKWANLNIKGTRLLHHGAGFCYPAVVSILLEAGADETARASSGCIPLDVIEQAVGREGPMNRGKEVAIRRMLQRGPAYRARSWTWPSNEKAGADCSGDWETAAAGAAASAGLSSPLAVKTPPVIGVRIFRPKENNSTSKCFVRLIGRYRSKV